MWMTGAPAAGFCSARYHGTSASTTRIASTPASDGLVVPEAL